MQATVQKVKAKRAARKTPEKKAERKAKRKKIFKGAKKVTFAPVRGAFLGLVLLAGALKKTKLKINLAGRLAQMWQKDNGAQLSKVWESFGGKPESLKAAIAKASKTQLNGVALDWSEDGTLQLDGIGDVTLATAGTAMALAAPILIAVTKLFRANNITDDGEAEVVEDVVEAAEDAAIEEGGDAAEYVNRAARKVASSALIRKATEIDDGGDRETQRAMKRDAEEEEAEEAEDLAEFGEDPEEESEDFEVEEDEGNFTKAAPKKSGGAAATNTANLPATAQQFAPPQTAKSILGNYRSPATWLKALIMLVPFQAHQVAGMLGGCFFIALVVSSIHFIATENKKYHGKIQY